MPEMGAPIGFMGSKQTVYDLVGGMATFERLVDAFYRRVADDPILRPMYPENLGPPRERLTLFLAQFFGGPAAYSEQRGHPRLGMRHRPFRIDIPARDAWLHNMVAALDETGIEEPARSIMLQYFQKTATFLTNTPARSG